MDSKGTLHIYQAKLSDTNKYVCRAENGYGEPVIASSFITISTATKVVKGKTEKNLPTSLSLKLISFRILGPVHQPFVMGSNYSLDCVVEVDPKLEESLSVTWLKDSEPVEIEGNERYYTEQYIRLK